MLIEQVDLNTEAFKPYGYIVSQPVEEPMADDEVITYWGRIAQTDIKNPVSFGLLHGHRRPLETNKLERHLDTPEVLVALRNDAVIICGKPSIGDSVDELKAFRVKQGNALCLYSRTWHWTPFPLEGEECTFLVMFAGGTEDCDLEIKKLPHEVEVAR